MFTPSPKSLNSLNYNAVSDGNVIGQNGTGVQCAPSFLFGKPQQGMKRRNLAPSMTGANSGGKSVHWSPLLVREQSTTFPKKKDADRDSAKSFGTSSLWNGPPLRSLLDEAPSEKQFRGDTSSSSFRQQVAAPSYSFNTPNLSTNSAFSVTENDKSNDCTKQREQDYWVTIFGFSSDQTASILEMFAKHGNIVAHKTAKPCGNWLHLRYSSTIHANQALSRNGKIFDGLMIGVLPCRDPEVINEEFGGGDILIAANNMSGGYTDGPSVGLNNSSAIDKSDFFLNGSRIIPSVSGNGIVPNESLNASKHSRLSISSRSGMRPLNRTDFAFEDSLNLTSQKADDSLLGKFWSYIS